jgi:REP element-mobilizing transposase RayT
VFAAVRRALAGAQGRIGLRLNHFTVQSNHLHLVVEAPCRHGLSRGMKGLAVRIAHRVNRQLDRRGQVVGERYHARILRTPAEVRNAVSYVYDNWKKHTGFDGVDRCSSAVHAYLVTPPRTWLLAQHGKVSAGAAAGPPTPGRRSPPPRSR